jgi:single-strand DNA-binding protein
MANDLNCCSFIGRAGANCDLKYTPSGDAVATVSIAVGKQWKGKDGQKQEKTLWVTLVFWRQLAEIAAKFILKGQQVFVSGELQIRKYQDRDGADRYATEVVCDKMQLLGSKGESSGDAKRPESRPAASGGGGTDGDYEEPPFDPNEEIPF